MDTVGGNSQLSGDRIAWYCVRLKLEWRKSAWVQIPLPANGRKTTGPLDQLVDHPSYTLVRMLREGKVAGSTPAGTKRFLLVIYYA